MRLATVVRKGLRTGLLCGALVLPKARAGAQRLEASRVAVVPVAASLPLVAAQRTDSVAKDPSNRRVVPVAASLPLVASQRTDSVAKDPSNRRAHILIGAGVGGALGGVFMAGSVRGFAGGALLGALYGGLIGAFLPHR